MFKKRQLTELQRQRIRLLTPFAIITLVLLVYQIHYISFTGEKITIGDERYTLGVKKTYLIDGGRQEITIKLSKKLNDELKLYSKELEKGPLNGWSSTYYKQLLNASTDEHFMKTLTAEIDQVIQENKTIYYGQEAAVIYAIEIVQTMNYDYVKSSTRQRRTKTPYETLYTQKGVCRETSLLLLKLLEEQGYGTAMVIIPNARHMIIGLRCNETKNEHKEIKIIKGYCMIDTTSRYGLANPGYSNNAYFFDEIGDTQYVITPIHEGKIFNFNYNYSIIT